MPDGSLSFCVCEHDAFGRRIVGALPKRLLLPENTQDIPDSVRCSACGGIAPSQDGLPGRCICPHDRRGRLPAWVLDAMPNPDQLGPESKPQTFQRYSATAYVERPRPTFLVEGLLQDCTTSAIVAPPGEYKTFVAIHLALCVTCGRHFFGRRTRKGRVLYILSEGGDGCVLRLQAWAKQHEVALPDELEIIPRAVQVCKTEQLDTLISTLKRHV